MSTIISPDDYSESQLKEIIKMLTLVPISKEAEKKKKYSFGKAKFFDKQKEHIPMYVLDYINDKPCIRVPFRFGCSLLGKLPNKEKEYPKIDYTFALSLRDYQVPIVEEAFLQLYQYSTTTLNLYTGAGKTKISTYLLAQTKLITCVMLNMQTLINGWVNNFAECFPDMKHRVWVVGEGPIPPDVCLIVCMDGRVDKIPDTLASKIGCLIIDEAHLFCTISKVKALLTLEPKYIIILTATLERDDGMEVMIHSIAGTHKIEKLSLKPYKLYKVNTGIKIPEEMGPNGLVYSALVNEQAKMTERNMIAINIIHGNPGHKYFIFTKTKEHVENLAALCERFNMPYDTLYGSKKKFEDKPILIFSVPKAGTGFDLSTALGDSFSGIHPDVLIMMTTMKSIPKLKQVLGRVLRSDNPNFVYLLDKNNVCKRHFNETKDMFIESKAKIYEIEFNSAIAGGGVVITNE
jgi:superfamily II DNA or RNA helicase